MLSQCATQTDGSVDVTANGVTISGSPLGIGANTGTGNADALLKPSAVSMNAIAEPFRGNAKLDLQLNPCGQPNKVANCAPSLPDAAAIKAKCIANFLGTWQLTAGADPNTQWFLSLTAERGLICAGDGNGSAVFGYTCSESGGLISAGQCGFDQGFVLAFTLASDKLTGKTNKSNDQIATFEKFDAAKLPTWCTDAFAQGKKIAFCDGAPCSCP